VVLAFDNCAHASETYAANFPCAERVLDTLGAGGLGEVAAAARVVAALGTDGGHLHASPPCQKVSGYNTSASAAERAQGVALTLWCVRVAARVRAHYARAGREAAFTFTLEQVVSLPVKAALETEGIAYAVVNAAFHGVPQSRRRLIVASPRALAALAARASERPTVAACALALPARAMLQIGTDNTPVRGGGHRPIRADECLRDPRTQPAHTVTSRGLRLIGCGHGLVRTTLEMDCALQTLGPPHVLLGNVTRQRKLCADAVPPALAEALMRAVRSVA
jgi:site-specific DNA-cytosine methylase